MPFSTIQVFFAAPSLTINHNVLIVLAKWDCNNKEKKMYKLLCIGLSLLALTACGERTTGAGIGGGGGGGGGGGDAAVPGPLAVNMSSADYDPVADTLSVSLYGFDHPELNGRYTRASALDVVADDGSTTYRAFTYQENTQSRPYLALFASGADSTAGASATYGEFGTHFGGTTFSRTGYSRPSRGSAQYRGNYVGLLTRPDTTDGVGPSYHLDSAHDQWDTSPVQRVRGDANIRVNFEEGEGHIEGGIVNRRVVGFGGPTGETPLDDLSLIDTVLTDGAFVGEVRIGIQGVGNYGGVLAGVGATEVAGVLVITPYTDDPYTSEFGTFVLPECSTANASSHCPTQ